MKEENQKEEIKVFDYVRDLRNAWEQRLGLMVENLNQKIEKLDNQIQVQKQQQLKPFYES